MPPDQPPPPHAPPDATPQAPPNANPDADARTNARGLPPPIGPEFWAALLPPAPPESAGSPDTTPSQAAPATAPQPGWAPHGGWDPNPKPSSFRGCATWTLLLLLILALAYAQQQPLVPVPPGPSNSASPHDPAQIASPILQFLSRYALGWKRLLGDRAAGDPNLRDLSERLDALALHPIDDLRLAVVQGELIGRHEAVMRLTQLLLTPNIPDDLQADARALLHLYRAGAQALSPQQAADLVQRHRWFGRLALVHDGSEPSRSGVLRPADRLVRAMGFAVAAAGCATLAGLVILSRALARARAGRFRWRYALAPHQAEGGSLAEGGSIAWVEAAVLFLAAIAAAQALEPWIPPDSHAAAALEAALWSLLAIPLWPLLRGVPRRSWRLALGCHRGEGLLREVGCGMLAYLAGLPVLFLGFLATLILHSVLGQNPLAQTLSPAQAVPGSHPVIYELALASPARTVALVLMLTLWAPLVEEAVFRGCLHNALRRRLGPLPAILITAPAFAIIHPQGLVAAPLLTALAFTLGVAREWRGSLIAPITLHALNNALVTCLLLLALA